MCTTKKKLISPEMKTFTREKAMVWNTNEKFIKFHQVMKCMHEPETIKSSQYRAATILEHAFLFEWEKENISFSVFFLYCVFILVFRDEHVCHCKKLWKLGEKKACVITYRIIRHISKVNFYSCSIQRISTIKLIVIVFIKPLTWLRHSFFFHFFLHHSTLSMHSLRE